MGSDLGGEGNESDVGKMENSTETGNSLQEIKNNVRDSDV